MVEQILTVVTRVGAVRHRFTTTVWARVIGSDKLSKSSCDARINSDSIRCR